MVYQFYIVEIHRNAAGEYVRAQILTKVSELTNDKGFIESVIDE